MEILGIIPARGGSKELKNKNIKPLLGKPLISYSIKQSLKSKYITKTIVMTDSKKIAEISKKYGAEVPFLEKPELAQDNSPMLPAIIYMISELKKRGYIPDLIVLLQPTCPLRSIEDIDSSIELMIKSKCDKVVTITKLQYPIEWTYRLLNDSYIKPLYKNHSKLRQKAKKLYRPNGSVYVMKTDKINLISPKIKAYIMPRERAIDIDSDIDLKLAEIILSNKN